MMYDSLHGRLLKLGDEVEVYPAHGAGSLCGKQMRPERQSTIGRERTTNYALQPKSKQEFVTLLTAELPERPGYFAADAEINRHGAHPLAELPPLAAFTPAEVEARQKARDLVLDTRPAVQFGAGHIPGALNIPLTGQYASSAAMLMGLDREIILIAEDQPAVEESRLRLARVGIEHVAGYLAGGMPAWAAENRPVAQIVQIPVDELKRELESDPGSIQVIDVRRAPEWESGHLPGALHRPLDKLGAVLTPAGSQNGVLAGIDRSKQIVVHCKGGYRSAIACSLIQRAGFENVANLTGGLDAWQAFGLPVVI